MVLAHCHLQFPKCAAAAMHKLHAGAFCEHEIDQRTQRAQCAFIKEGSNDCFAPQSSTVLLLPCRVRLKRACTQHVCKMPKRHLPKQRDGQCAFKPLGFPGVVPARDRQGQGVWGLQLLWPNHKGVQAPAASSAAATAPKACMLLLQHHEDGKGSPR